jgi:hypothetical protein
MSNRRALGGRAILRTALVMATVSVLIFGSAAGAAAAGQWKVTADPKTVNFGTVEVGDSAHQFVFLTNDTPVNLYWVAIDGASHLIDFDLATSGNDYACTVLSFASPTPTPLAPGASCFVVLIYSPQDVGRLRDSITFGWTDYGQTFLTSATVKVSGRAVAPN